MNHILRPSMAPRAVPQTQIPHTSRLFQDFLYAYPRVSEFYPSPPFAPEGMRASAEAIRYPEPLRARVAEVLREPAEHAPAESATRRNLERFARPGCCAVVTGQQVGLFSGPAFTLYKALTAIKLAARLSEQGIEAVPVFWLATEDHDLAEVNHCYVQDREGKPVRLQYEEASRLEQAPVGTIRFNPSIRTVLDSLRAALPESDDARALLEQIEHCYRPGADFGEAFGSLLARLLWRYGVLMLASSDARLHRLARGVFRTAIECAGEISRELRGRNERLAQAGYHAQVRVAENSTVLFLHEGGRRSALHFEEGQFVSSRGNRYERAQLLEMLESDPALFSPSALLRPVMQDALLPTVAYVGGPSEIAYLAQSAVLYQRFLERMPVVFPRASFTILDP
ncbi:MAG TPA: bacillithiol biosynthesis cysteine-adding enzyme BshC, partial [Terriglobia bacterium]|nr:bacillithiol biosynthesis cysteine-adding enzyme BshC [Terriglobia bacterium]